MKLALSSSALALIGVLTPMGVPPAMAAGQQPRGPEQTITVDARERWTDTGLDVQRDEELAFDVTGQVQLSADPADVAAPAGSATGRLASEAPLPGQLAGALIGRIDTGPAFGIGDQAALRVPRAGHLYLSVNDDHLADNTGAFRVRLRGGRPRATAAPTAPAVASGAKGPSLLERLQRVLAPTTVAPDAGAALAPCPTDVNVRWDNCYGALALGDGRRVVGDWRGDKLNGRGLYVWPDGRVYLGEFVNDQRQGRGTLYGPTGAIESAGQWESDRVVRSDTAGAEPPCPTDPNTRWDGCFSRVTMRDGARYLGEWRNDAVAGVGMYTYPDGHTYLGELAANQRHGRGTLYGADGRVTSAGRWQNDVLVDSVAVPLPSPGLAPGPAVAPLPGPPQVVPGGMVGVPSFESAPRQGPVREPSLDADLRRSPGVTSNPSSTPAVRLSAPAAPAPNACTPGPALEPRDYADAPYIGLPPGGRARMCYYKSDGRSVDQLRFYPGGIFTMTGQSGSGGFAMGGAVLQTIRGTYGIGDNGRLNLRIAYSGIGVTQTTRGAGTSTSLDVSGQGRLDKPFTLPNCQQITLRDEQHAVVLGPVSGRGHPDFLLLDGVRWERDLDCGDWEGWK